jgi:hypothetical protein
MIDYCLSDNGRDEYVEYVEYVEYEELPETRAYVVGLTYHGECIDRYLTLLPKNQRASIAKFIKVRTELIRKISRCLPHKDAQFAAQMVFYAIDSYETEMPKCTPQVEQLIVAYFRDICHDFSRI